MKDLAASCTVRAARLKRLLAGGTSTSRAPHDEQRPGGFAVLLTAAWFGLVAGVLEVGLQLGRIALFSAATLGFHQVNRHFLWMIPVSCLMILGACGLLLVLAARAWPRPVHRTAPFLLSFLAFLSVLLTLRKLHAVACALLACGLALRTARWVWADPPRFRRLVRRSLPALVGLVLALAGVQPAWEFLAGRRAHATVPAVAAGAPNVLLIVLDTVRADATSLHGYHRDTTPHLARLARKGIRFDQARAPAPWTLPSHASLFTGRWPHELSARQDRPLDATYPTLAEFLAARGYATAGFAANTYFCNAWYGLDRGFAHFEDYVVSAVEALRSSGLGLQVVKKLGAAQKDRPDSYFFRKDAARINRDFLAWLSGPRATGRPFFVFLNYYDAHDPYIVPDGFDRHFGLVPTTAADRQTLQRWDHVGKQRKPTSREVRLARDAYDDCIASLDAQLGQLLDELERRGVLENTLVIVTSDHGEAFGEGDFFGHGFVVSQPVVHVPLLIIPPSGLLSGRSVPTPVSLRDVPATVAHLLGLQEQSPFPGGSLASYWHPSSEPDRAAIRPVLSETVGRQGLSKWGAMWSLVADGRVYICKEDGTEELYDLATDPAETHNRADAPDSRPILERSRATLRRALQPSP